MFLLHYKAVSTTEKSSEMPANDGKDKLVYSVRKRRRGHRKIGGGECK
ncbi:unnamed protein product [Brassica napus]|uniref:(rape) hypothetical protein n=1 Tax=Brassica napus TaxID=3708 RepID=A0A816ISA1_BRANA|nr:unnamed protein product [Brassica napus]